MNVLCSVAYTEEENDNGHLTEGVEVTCGECDHKVFSFGTSGASIRRCFAVMRDECPSGESNFYEEE